MSFELESGVITRVIEEADIRSLIRQKVTKDFFFDDGMREIYTWLVKQYERFGRVPSLQLLQREFADFEPQEIDDDLMAMVDQLKREKLYSDLSRALRDVTEATRDDPEEGYHSMLKHAGELMLMHSGGDDMDLTKETGSIRDEYMRMKNGEGLAGIPWVWPHMNKITLGKQAGEFTAFYARPKSFKTWVSLVDADYVHSEFGKVVGYASCEMPLAQIKRRLAAIRAKVPYDDFRAGKLNDVDEKRFFEALEEIEESPPFFMFSPSETGQAGIAEIRSKVEEYQLDILYVDGFYYLMEEESPRAFRVVTRGLKKTIAEGCKIPVIGTSQANRAGEKLRGTSTVEVGFGDSLSQDADNLIRIIREQQHVDADELMFVMPALREARGGTFTIHAKPAVDFSQKNVFDNEDGQQQASTGPDDDGMIM